MRIVLLLACASLMAASCASPGPAKTKPGYVQVLSSGAILVNGRSVPADNVGPAMKAKGFGPRASINVNVPNDVSQEVLKKVTISLASSGFTRVIFIKPQQAFSDVKSGALKE